MRTYLSIALLGLVSIAFSSAFAAQRTAGTLLYLDLDSGTLLMSDNITYYLPRGFDDPGFYEGDEIVILWKMQDDVPVVKLVTANDMNNE